MIREKLNSLMSGSKKEATLLETWEKYLSTNPSTDNLSSLFIRYGGYDATANEEIIEMMWKELKAKDDIENRHLLNVIDRCSNLEKIVVDAWSMISREDLKGRDLSNIIRSLGSSHPISQEIQRDFGMNQEVFLQEIDKLIVK